MVNIAYKKSLQGFTLLETIVALSVLAISLGFVYQVFASSMQGAAIANDYAKASMYADSHLATISKQVHLYSGETEGKYNKRYRWNLKVQPLDAQRTDQVINNRLNRYQVVLSVFWKGKLRERSIKAMTFRLSAI